MIIRTAYLLDIDNLAGSGQATQPDVLAVVKAFEQECRPGVNDQVYCAATAMAAFHLKALRPGYTVLVGRGQDGTDRRLLDLAEPNHMAKRFQRVVVGSGDGIFAPLVSALRARGLKVSVLKGRGHIAHQLYRAVGTVKVTQANPVVSLALAV